MVKVIYINYQPLTKRFFTDYYLDICIENGFEIEYWDISQIYFKKLKLKDMIDLIEVKKILSFRELKRELFRTDIGTTLFITNITFEFKVLRLFRILSKNNCKLAFFARGMYPAPIKKAKNKILEILSSYDLRRMINGILNRFAFLLKKTGVIKTYNIIFRAGSEGIITIGAGYSFELIKSKIVDINYFDFDKFLSNEPDDLLLTSKYCIYLDEYLPYHPDWQITGEITVKPNEYYRKMNNFFEIIENKMNIEVIIAAHPKALKYEKTNPFNGRRIIFGKTCQLVRNSLFAITHHSTSISFPMLYGKPIVFITSENQKKIMPLLYQLTIHLAQFTNSPIIFFDKYKGEDFSLNVDKSIFKDYKYKYLTSKESENRLSSEIFIETILKL